MLNVNHITELQLLLFAIVFLRMISFVMSSALLGSPSVPSHVKILLSLTLTIVVFPLIKYNPDQLSYLNDNIISITIKEVFVGLTLGLLTRLFFFVVSMVGDLVSISMGLNSAQMFNPSLGSYGNSVEQFHATLGTLLFFVLQGHHILIISLFSSFEAIPVFNIGIELNVFGEMSMILQNLLIISIKMASPVIISIFLSNIAMGILGRAVPQMNVLVTSMPVTIFIGFIVMFTSLPLLLNEMNEVINITSLELFKVMKGL